MVTHSSTLAWKMPWTEEPGRLSPWGHQESDPTERLHFHFHALEKEMAAHSSVLAWRIPGTGEPGGLLSMGSHRIGHNWSDLAAAAAFLRDPLPKWSLTTIRLFKTSWHRLCWQNTQNLNYDRKLSGFCRKSAELFGRRQKALVATYLSKGIPGCFQGWSSLCKFPTIIHPLCRQNVFFAIKMLFHSPETFL